MRILVLPPDAEDCVVAMPDSNRLEREIEEILGKIEQFPDAGTRRRRSANRTVQRIGATVSEGVQGVVRRLSRFSISQVMLLSFILILASLFFRGTAAGLMGWVLYAGIILFVTSFAISLFGGRGGSAPSSPRWRGRTIQQYPSAPSLSQRVRYWWNTRVRR